MRRSHNRANTIDKASKKKSKLRRKRKKGLKWIFRRYFSSKSSILKRLTGLALLVFLALLIASLAMAGWKFLRLIEEKNAMMQQERTIAVEETESLLAGRMAMGETDYDVAVKYFTRVTELNPKSIEGWATLANLHLKLGNEQEALDMLRRRNELQPEDAGQYFLAMRIYQRQGKKEEALQAAKEAVRVSSSNPLYSNMLYILRIQSGELEQVCEELEKMGNISKVLEPTLIFGRAAVALAQGDLDGSIDYILRARNHLTKDTFSELYYEDFFTPAVNKITAAMKVRTGESPSNAPKNKESIAPIVEHMNDEKNEKTFEEKTESTLQPTEQSERRPSGRLRQR